MTFRDKLPQLEGVIAQVDIEAEMRKLLDTDQTMNFAVTVDSAGVNYSFSSSLPDGRSENYSRRVPRVNPTEPEDETHSPPLSPGPGQGQGAS